MPTLPILRYTLAFPTCRNADILDSVSEELQRNWMELVKQKGWTIWHLSIQPNYVNLVVEVPADVSPWAIATAFKRDAASRLFNLPKGRRKRALKRWPLPSMWTRQLRVSKAQVIRQTGD